MRRIPSRAQSWREAAATAPARDAVRIAGAQAPPPNEPIDLAALHLAALVAELELPIRANRGPAADQVLRTSIVETISALEKTKHNFRSRELGELRRRLQQTLAVTPVA